MPDMLIVCDHCEFQFDAMDRRSWVSTNPTAGTLCPLCTVRLRSAEAWCVWNDCQGVWEDTIHARRFGAAEFLKTTHADIGGCVVPVRIFREPDDEVWQREWREREYHEKAA